MNINKLTIITLLGIATLAACKDEPLPAPDAQQAAEQQQLEAAQPDDMMQLGQELQDPYRLSNMQQAYANITGSKALLQPTHRYMRFLPKTEDEYDALKYSGLELFDFPLHYEIAQPGSQYHDPSLPAEAITWRYAVIPMGQVFPESIEHELLYEVFIPDHDADGSKSGLLERLEIEAMRITGHTDELIDTDGVKGISWNPSGTVSVWDDALNRYIPLHGVKVRANFTTRAKWEYTDSEGYYRLPSFLFKVNYTIIWERADYDIRDGRFGQAKFNGPNQKSGWSPNIGSGKQLMFASIHRAAYKMFYGNNLGITNPKLIAGKSTKIACIDEHGDDLGEYDGNVNALGIFTTIKIWSKTSGGSYHKTYDIFKTTAHELGHQSHARLLNNVQYVQVSKYVRESWADAVMWAITKNEYETWSIKLGYPARYYEYDRTNHFLWPHVIYPEYTPIFIDLMDAYNQGDYPPNLILSPNEKKPNDQVSGYTLKYINDNILPSSYGISSLYHTLKEHLIAGVTQEQLDLLFELYWEY